jgi:hypothetical protein
MLRGKGTFKVNGTISNNQADTIESSWYVVVANGGTVSNTGDDPMENIAIQAFDYYNGSDLVLIESGGTVYAPYAKAIQLENTYNLLNPSSEMSGVTGLVDDDGETYDVYGNVVFKKPLFNQLKDESVNGDEDVTVTITSNASLTLETSDEILSPGETLSSSPLVFYPAVTVVAESGGKLILNKGVVLQVKGTIVVDPGGILENGGRIDNYSNNTLLNRGLIHNLSTGEIYNYGRFDNSNGTVNNEGKIFSNSSIGGTVNGNQVQPLPTNGESGGSGGCSTSGAFGIATLILAGFLALKKKHR